ncbi:hypothetical protein NDU88_006196 [Pleurodeles waltl]|uniref:ABC transmembrane type-1 domain-containing protein n=1 Tax=Pleurodeles waltl TaxID=8319 RepID=A0AAV7MD81_PLEWA|nr:hypothetical protein NDU88_006196 [Pleurodeles waltl]
MKEDAVNINELAEFPIDGYNNPCFQNDENHDKKNKEKKYKNRDGNTNIKETNKNMVGLLELFTFADAFDIFLMTAGFICSFLNGLGMPTRIVIFGQMTDIFIKKSITNSSEVPLANRSECSISSGTDLESQISTYAWYYAGLGIILFILSFFQVWTFFLTATRQTARIRCKFFYAVLHQEVSWFDTAKTGTLNKRLTNDINTIRDGLGDKVSMFAQNLSTFVGSMVVGFVYGWKLTLVTLSLCPLLAASAAVWSKLLGSLAAKEMAAYGKAGAVAEEILSAIRTVVAYNGQHKAVAKYEINLQEVRNAGMKKSFATYSSMGISQLLFYSTFGLGLWYGTKLTVDEPDNYSIGSVITNLSVVLFGSFTLGQTVPNLESFASSRVAAYDVYQIIKKKRLIDSSSTDGHKPDKLTGRIEFKDIHFSYQSRPDVHILKGLHLNIEPGKTIALVGSSGCGKSTLIHLLQRFYDPLQGEITLDGHDIRTINVKWLREKIGVVSQEPVLFRTTIADNIRYGREGVTDSEIQQAAIEANAYDFISNLPEAFSICTGPLF